MTTSAQAVTSTKSKTVTATQSQTIDGVAATGSPRSPWSSPTRPPAAASLAGTPSGGLEWWGWLLIGCGAAAAGVGGYVLWRRHRERTEPSFPPTDPPPDTPEEPVA